MALLFTDSGSTKVTFGTAVASLTAPYTMWAWICCNDATPTNNDGIMGKFGATNFREFTVRTTGQFDMGVDMTTTNATARSANSAGNLLLADTWQFVACSLSSSYVPRLYLGSLTANVAELSYVTQTTGVGTPDSDSGVTFTVGGRDSATRGFPGKIACFGAVLSELSVGQLRQIQFSPLKNPFTHVILGELHGTGTQPDLSGNGNNGTVTGATATGHVPLRPMFGFGDGWRGNYTAPVSGVVSPRTYPLGMNRGINRSIARRMV